VRCVVIGGMVETGFWQALSDRFEKSTGIHVSVVASGNKAEIGPVFATGKADLVTMHASDAILNLVADGYATDARPWAKNDMMIVGPPDDPAGIKGMSDVAAALRKIADTKANFVVHSSLGAQEVLRTLLDENGIALDPDHTTVLFSDRSRQVLQIAADRHAYTLVGRIPFLDHKLGGDAMAPMVRGDPRLRRPYLVAVANPNRFPTAHVDAARKLADFLLAPQTQAWIADYGRGRWDDQPLFFPLPQGAPMAPPGIASPK
jgi:tungstate transport system substrate-binding protein